MSRSRAGYQASLASRLRRTISQALVRTSTGAIRGYQLFISPWQGPSCRYYPSCSTYAVTALSRHGMLRGMRLALWRLLRCHPWTRGGVDDVPD